MKSHEIQKIINEAFEGVEKSKIGNIFVRNKDGNIELHEGRSPICNTLAMQTFLTILNNVIPKPMIGDISMKESNDDN